METSSILNDPVTRERINRIGGVELDPLIYSPSFSLFFAASYAFAIGSELMTLEISKAVEAANRVGKASMSMLGSSVFAYGGQDLEILLKQFGKIKRCRIDNQGARIID